MTETRAEEPFSKNAIEAAIKLSLEEHQIPDFAEPTQVPTSSSFSSPATDQKLIPKIKSPLAPRTQKQTTDFISNPSSTDNDFQFSRSPSLLLREGLNAQSQYLTSSLSPTLLKQQPTLYSPKESGGCGRGAEQEGAWGGWGSQKQPLEQSQLALSAAEVAFIQTMPSELQEIETSFLLSQTTGARVLMATFDLKLRVSMANSRLEAQASMEADLGLGGGVAKVEAAGGEEIDDPVPDSLHSQDAPAGAFLRGHLLTHLYSHTLTFKDN